MKPSVQGVLSGSNIFFHCASDLAKEMFLYPLCVGRYDCDNTYIVKRKSYDSFLIIYVHSGSGYIEQDDKKIYIGANSIVFIDCYKPHTYYTTSSWNISWIHFDGIQAKKYYEVCSKNGVAFSAKNALRIERSFNKILDIYNENRKVNEAVLSNYITDLLTQVYLSAMSIDLHDKNLDMVEETIAYIAENSNRPISIDELAERVSFSKFHFIRVFKKTTGSTPHECIMKMRVDIAKFMLKSTDSSIKEISFKSGFNSESSFCSAFKLATGVTPKTYRTKENKINNN